MEEQTGFSSNSKTLWGVVGIVSLVAMFLALVWFMYTGDAGPGIQ